MDNLDYLIALSLNPIADETAKEFENIDDSGVVISKKTDRRIRKLIRKSAKCSREKTAVVTPMPKRFLRRAAVAADGYLTVFKKVGDDLEYVAEGITHVTTGSLAVSVHFQAEHGVEYLAIFEGEVRKEGEEFTYGEMFGINTTKVCP